MKCPNCSTKLIVKEKLDVTLLNDNVTIDVAGWCPNCGNKYLWTQYYNLSNEHSLEKDED